MDQMIPRSHIYRRGVLGPELKSGCHLHSHKLTNLKRYSSPKEFK